MDNQHRTLDDILRGARAEAPVVRKEELPALLQSATIVRGGAKNTFFTSFRSRIMIVAAFLTTAAVAGLWMADSDSRSPVGQLSTVRTQDTPLQQRPAGDLATSAEPSTAAENKLAKSNTDNRPQATDHRPPAADNGPATAAPSPGENSWGYRFTKGMVFRYARTSELSNPDADDSFTRSEETEIRVLEIDKDGNVWIELRTIRDTMDRPTEIKLPNGIVVTRPGAPRAMRMKVSRLGEFLDGAIIMKVDTGSANREGSLPVIDRVKIYWDAWFVELPAIENLQPGSNWSDTTISKHPYVHYDEREPEPLVMREYTDTTIRNYRLAGKRMVDGVECTLVTISTRSFHTTDRNSSSSNGLEEVYLRNRDGVIVKRTTSSTTSGVGATGSAHRSTVKLLGESTSNEGDVNPAAPTHLE